MNRIPYEQRALAVLKATACSRGTISATDLAWSIDYQRVTRPLPDLLLVIRPLLESNGWPPLTCLVAQTGRHQPLLEVDQGLDLRMRQRACWAWATEQSADRRAHVIDLLGGDSA